MNERARLKKTFWSAIDARRTDEIERERDVQEREGYELCVNKNCQIQRFPLSLHLSSSPFECSSREIVGQSRSGRLFPRI